MKRVLKEILFCYTLVVSARTWAFSSIPIPTNSRNVPSMGYNTRTNSNEKAEKETASISTAPWRIVLDIGREPLATGMPFDWARSGCRMPIVVPCEFSSDSGVQPMKETISFTGPDGAVIKPIEGGSWELKGQSELSFSLTFPETFARRDVEIEAGTTIRCSGTIFTKTKMDQLNAEFYEAREEAWQIGGELNDMSQRQGAPKKWNEETKRWEKRYDSANPFSWAQKRIEYMAAKAKQDQKNRERPQQKVLSNRGPFPGVKGDDIFILKEGVVRAPNGAVMGKWSAEPIVQDKRPPSNFKY